MKIAIGGIATENSTFSVWTTKLSDFSITSGDDLLAQYDFLSRYSDVSFIPIVRGRALPGGPVEMAAYEHIKGQMIDGLKAEESWDGVFLHMHGAMHVKGMEDAEGDWMQAVRAAVGESCLISASYDLHGNVSQRVFDNVDILTAYRTAPHVDAPETVERAVELLIHCLKNDIRPQNRRIRVPIALPGEKTSTEWEPGKSLYTLIPPTVAKDTILDVSITVGYAWADEPRSSATVLVYGTDQGTVDQEALRLAQHYWHVRREFDFGVPAGTSDECIQWALDAPESTVFISDSGDNPTAGGVGDVTYTLGRLIELNVESAVYASIPDAAAVEACHKAGVGADVEVKLGGKLDTIYSQPLTVKGTVLSTLVLPRHEYRRELDGQTNKQAVLQVGGVKIIITEHRTPFHYIAHFQRLGIEPLEHKLVVIKIGYLEPDLKKNAPKAFLALSPGAVNQALDQLPYKRIQRPIFPLDPNMDWQPSLD